MIIEIGLRAHVQNEASLYPEASVRYFADNEIASQYYSYLQEKVNTIQGNTYQPYWYEIEVTENFDKTDAQRNDALAKLTPQEKQLLGVE